MLKVSLAVILTLTSCRYQPELDALLDIKDPAPAKTILPSRLPDGAQERRMDPPSEWVTVGDCVYSVVRSGWRPVPTIQPSFGGLAQTP
jgi:hypothetical protein